MSMLGKWVGTLRPNQNYEVLLEPEIIGHHTYSTPDLFFGRGDNYDYNVRGFLALLLTEYDENGEPHKGFSGSVEINPLSGYCREWYIHIPWPPTPERSVATTKLFKISGTDSWQLYPYDYVESNQTVWFEASTSP